MIERLLEADRLLALGLHDQAERIYWQAVELDPQNAIAVVGLARVALERGDERTALEFARKALEMDPESPAAQRLVARLEEVIAYRDGTEPPPRPVSVPAPVAAPEAEAGPEPETAQEPAAEPEAAPEQEPAAETAQEPRGEDDARRAASAPTPPASPAGRPGQRPQAGLPAGHRRRGLWRRLLGGR